MINKLEELNPEGFYHIYNRANGEELMFRNDENYRYFLQQFIKFVDPFVEVYSYCLMPNHFHFLIKVKTESQIRSVYTEINPIDIQRTISKKFSNFFSSYTQSFNKVFNRRGSLFMKPYKRIIVKDQKYLLKLIHYIHYNPINAGLTTKLDNWKYSSYKSIIGNSPTLVKRDEIIELFEDLANFKHFHKLEPFSINM